MLLEATFFRYGRIRTIRDYLRWPGEGEGIKRPCDLHEAPIVGFFSSSKEEPTRESLRVRVTSSLIAKDF